MAFVSVRGLKGKVYVPEKPQEGARKHPCQDCYACQRCRHERCSVCLSQKTRPCAKSSNN